MPTRLIVLEIRTSSARTHQAHELINVKEDIENQQSRESDKYASQHREMACSQEGQ